MFKLKRYRRTKEYLRLIEKLDLFLDKQKLFREFIWEYSFEVVLNSCCAFHLKCVLKGLSLRTKDIPDSIRLRAAHVAAYPRAPEPLCRCTVLTWTGVICRLVSFFASMGRDTWIKCRWTDQKFVGPPGSSCKGRVKTFIN